MISLAFALVVVMLWLWRRLPVYRLAGKLPSETLSLPILGHTYLFFGLPQQAIFSRMRTIIADDLKSAYSQLWFGPQLAVVVTGAECVDRVLYDRSLLHKADLLHPADNLVGNGLLFGSGPEVKRRRRGIIPAFKIRMLEQYVEVFSRHSRLLLEVLKETVVEGKDFHLEKVLHCCSFDAVNETSIGTRTNCLLGQNSALIQSLIDVYGLLYEEIVKPWLYHGRNLVRRLGYKFRADHICDMLDLHINTALRRVKIKLEKEKVSNAGKHSENGFIEKSAPQGGSELQNGGVEQDGADCGSDVMSTMEFLLRSDFEISDEDLTMEIKNIYLAASDTVAQICSFLFKMFSVHPEYQERAYREAVEVLADADHAPLMSELSRLTYIECCLKETLRLFPIAPLVPRKTEADLRLDDKITLPPETTILVGAFWTHRSTQYWQHPHKFFPDHFSPEQQAARHRGAYLPFSGGAHSCIGQQYATLFMKIIVAYVLLNYRVEPSESDSCQRGQDGAHQNCHSARTDFVPNGSVNKTQCSVNDCITEDYVSNMNLSVDISIRLIGGIDVKLRRRDKV